MADSKTERGAAKATPGPWWPAPDRHGILMLNNNGSRTVMAGEADDALPVCEVGAHIQCKRGTGHRADCPVREANARLISAAPDLLAALKAFAFGDATLESLLYADLPDDAHGTTTIRMRDIRAARAAIAKAQGEAS